MKWHRRNFFSQLFFLKIFCTHFRKSICCNCRERGATMHFLSLLLVCLPTNRCIPVACILKVVYKFQKRKTTLLQNFPFQDFSLQDRVRSESSFFDFINKYISFPSSSPITSFSYPSLFLSLSFLALSLSFLVLSLSSCLKWMELMEMMELIEWS